MVIDSFIIYPKKFWTYVYFFLENSLTRPWGKCIFLGVFLMVGELFNM
ncbi:hypothetical protein N784_16145 [Pontibacillus litoralis JSM 072002]|uniref:Uncharacterized protein n=1 Tax=Pontibacillus litoralis JSM 072002 TaxID=1385512 RepID=A0A0A5G2B4_9BACI|nr:hypothetical protein N784_16145 [Pontibacillus litoralis JSM 072002]